MGCPANCGGHSQKGRLLATSHFQENDVLKASLDRIDLQLSETLARARRDFGLSLIPVLGVFGFMMSEPGSAPELSQLARIGCVVASFLALPWFDYLFHKTRQALVKDALTRASITEDLCPEVR